MNTVCPFGEGFVDDWTRKVASSSRTTRSTTVTSLSMPPLALDRPRGVMLLTLLVHAAAWQGLATGAEVCAARVSPSDGCGGSWPRRALAAVRRRYPKELDRSCRPIRWRPLLLTP